MSNSTNPPWLREESVEPLKAGNNSPLPNSSGGGPAAGMLQKHKTLYWTLKVVTMALCALMFMTAIIGFGYISGVEAAQKIFIVIYMMFFSALLFIFELIEIRPVEWVDHMMRRNFGFLYSAVGKGLYIIFIAFLSFGLSEPETLTMATGGSLAVFGFVNFGLYLKYPELYE